MSLFGSTPAEFASDFPLEESVERLRAEVAPLLTAGLRFRQCAAGRVSTSGVSLCRVIPLHRNPFQPFFIGTFDESEGKVVLKGAFTLHPAVKTLMSLWLVYSAVWVVVVGMAVLAPRPGLLLALFGVLVSLAGVGVAKLGQAWAGNDPAWLSAVIQRALSKGGG
jgi:hypothetical protein